MNVFHDLIAGLATAFAPMNLLYCLLGVTLGTLVGVLPGIGALAAVAMLLPISFHLDPTAAIILLAGIYYGGEYGGSTSSILLNLPGDPSSAVTCLDGNPLAKQGRAGHALFVAAMASLVGGTSGIILLILLSPVLAQFALDIGSPEYFALMAMGLIASATMSEGPPAKGIAMVVVGLMLGTVGLDATGTQRFTFDNPALFEGINLVALAMGLFGISEVISSANRGDAKVAEPKIALRSMLLPVRDMIGLIPAILRGTAIGAFFGVLPGTGQTIASFMSYGVEKRLAADPSRFGKGALEGVAAPEASNNAAVQTSFIPALTLGIPGKATMALLLGALMVHGINPGPVLMRDHLDLFWALVGSFWIGNVLLVILNVPLIGIWVRILSIPYVILYPVVIVLVCIGAYTMSNNPFDVYMVFLFGVIGYAMRLFQYNPAPLLLGFVLGPMMEENFRRAMLLSQGDFLFFFRRPLSGVILAITVVLLLWPLIGMALPRQKSRASVRA